MPPSRPSAPCWSPPSPSTAQPPPLGSPPQPQPPPIRLPPPTQGFDGGGGTADLDRKKARDEKILYNRFLRTWRTRISVLVAEGTAKAVWSLTHRRSPSLESRRCAAFGGHMGSQPLIDVRL